MNINFSYLCENTFLLSFIISVICIIIIAIDDKYNDKLKPYFTYIKLFVIFYIALNGMNYIKNCNKKNADLKYNNVKLGEPNF